MISPNFSFNCESFVMPTFSSGPSDPSVSDILLYHNRIFYVFRRFICPELIIKDILSLVSKHPFIDEGTKVLEGRSKYPLLMKGGVMCAFGARPRPGGPHVGGSPRRRRGIVP
jgi:hypothetical protein